MTLQELETHLPALSPVEKTEVLRKLSLDVATAAARIEKTARIAGGDACVSRTRIPVWTLVSYRRLGWSEARILENFPSLRAVDLVNAWSYADHNPDGIAQAIRENEAA